MIKEGISVQPFLITPPCPQDLHIWQVWYWIPSGHHSWKMDNWFTSNDKARVRGGEIVREMRTWVRIVEIDFTEKRP